MDIEAFRRRAKLAEDQIAQLETTIKQLVKSKCSKYRYEIVYYGIKNRGNFARLLFAEADIPYDAIQDRGKVMTYMKCQNKLSEANKNKLSIDLFAPPAIIRYPRNKSSNEEIVAISQTEAIVGFLATEFNLRPSSLEDFYRGQMLVSNANDILSEIFDHRNDKYDDLNKFYSDRMQRWLGILQKPLTQKPGQEYYFDDRCLAVDIAVFNICDGIIEVMGDRIKDLFIKTHPILYRHYKRIRNRKNIKPVIDKQNKNKMPWWPAYLGFPATTERLNGREEVEEKKESSGAVGGWKQADKDEINAAAQAVKSEVEKQAKSQNQPKFTKYQVISGTKQVCDSLCHPSSNTETSIQNM